MCKKCGGTLSDRYTEYTGEGKIDTIKCFNCGFREYHYNPKWDFHVTSEPTKYTKELSKTLEGRM